jgi:hypothetical protein
MHLDLSKDHPEKQFSGSAEKLGIFTKWLMLRSQSLDLFHQLIPGY